MIRKFFVATLLAICMPEAAIAGTYALRRAVDDAFQRDPASYTVEARRALSLAQDRYWSDLLQKMPNLPAEEQSKVLKGINSPDNFEHAEAIGSKNGMIFLSMNSVAECKVAAGELHQIVGGSAKAEASAWLKLIQCFDNARGLPHTLKAAGVTSEINYLQPYDLQGVGTWSSRAVGVVERLLMDWR